MNLWIFNRKRIDMADRVSNNLALRQSADDLFDFINSTNEKNIVLDFLNVKTMSGSFAHQYLINKQNSKKKISEINMNSAIKKMFVIIQKRWDKAETRGGRVETTNPPKVIEVIV